jgi:hypothetical protein
MSTTAFIALLEDFPSEFLPLTDAILHADQLGLAPRIVCAVDRRSRTLRCELTTTDPDAVVALAPPDEVRAKLADTCRQVGEDTWELTATYETAEERFALELRHRERVEQVRLASPTLVLMIRHGWTDPSAQVAEAAVQLSALGAAVARLLTGARFEEPLDAGDPGARRQIAREAAAALREASTELD